jgi:hypothetical protein
MLNRLARIVKRLFGATEVAADSTRASAFYASQKFFADIQSSARAAEAGRLLRFTRKVFSQGVEDGMLEEIFRRIGIRSKTVVEIGCGSGLENNSMYLLFQGWRALWIDANAANIAAARKTHKKWLDGGSLTLSETFVTDSNVDSIIGSFVKVPGNDLDLLSVDIDSYDYWVLKSAIGSCNPRVVSVEYNGHFAPPLAITVPNGAPIKGSFYGASLCAFEKLLADRYCLVGCTPNGVNAFFVRKDLELSHFAAPLNAENHFEPWAFEHLPAFDVNWVQV